MRAGAKWAISWGATEHMLTNLLILILEAVFGFFTLILLGRFFMQWTRVSFRNQIGHFVIALTDWIVVPARRFIPGMLGLDMASLTLAWFAQTVLLALELALRGFSLGGEVGAAIVAVLGVGLVETLRTLVYLVFGVVIVAAILSWVSPHAPVAPLFNALSRPFLRPIQRVVPPIANIDLSPLVLLLILQVLLMVLAYLRAGIFGMLT